MGVVEIVLVVCLLAAPEECHEERPVWETVSLERCVRDGQVQASIWVNEHPGYRLSRWRCEHPTARQQPT